MYIRHLIVGPVDTNCYIVALDDSDKCVVIDPGDEAESIIFEAEKSGKKITAVLLTHGHFDHISAVAELRKNCNLTVYAYEGEKEMLSNPEYNLSGSFGNTISETADVYFSDGEVINEAGLDFEVIYTPGHTSGSVCFYIKNERALFSGDTLFEMSVGRTDFPTGSSSKLKKSIKDRLFILPDDVVVYPGHGNSTDIGCEKMNNMFV